MMYSEETLIRVARRENNNKRGYLLVNALQGKHLPVAPTQTLALFAALAGQLRAAVAGERVLVVGFAETATAIGAALATALECPYLQTTREWREGRDYLYFTEAHSHATEQKLDREDMARMLPEIDRVVFAEDELTTGNTILDLVSVLEREFGPQLHFGAACLVSGMSEQARAVFADRDIPLCTLLDIDPSGYGEKARGYTADGAYLCLPPQGLGQTRVVSYPGLLDARRLVDGAAYRQACQALWQRIRTEFPLLAGERVLVLGTEEFMYPALVVAAGMEELGAVVRFHATTRSPISVSAQPDYPLHVRCQLQSLYDPERSTFVYELANYQQVFVVTDAALEQSAGLETLLAALRQAGNETIHVVRWCES